MGVAEVCVPRARLIVAVAAMVASAAILWLARSYTFYFDEWDFILSAPEWNLTTYLEPHNEHPSILFRLVYGVMLNTVGLRSYAPYMVVLLALHALDAVLLFEVVRRRAGDLPGMASAACLLVLGSGWEEILWAFQMAWLASIACGLGMLLVLQGRATSSKVAAAAGLLAGSLMFSGIGLVFSAVAVVLFAATPGRRRKLLWLVPVGIALGAWYLAFGHSGRPSVPPGSSANLLVLPAYMAWGLAASAGGLIGVTGAPALVVLIFAAAALGFTWRRHRPDPLALGAAAGLISFYVLISLARGQIGYDQSASGRYVYIGAVFWLILLADAVKLLPWRGTWRPALAACLFLACFSSSVQLVEWAAAKSLLMQREVADLQALAVARTDPCLNPAGIADRLVMPQVTNPALYYRATDRYGDPTRGLPITDRTDFENARRNLVRRDCP